MSRRRKRKSSSSHSAWRKKAPSPWAERAPANLSEANPKSPGVSVWTAPDVQNPAAKPRMATVGGLADLQAEAHKEAFEQGLAEGREAGRAEVRAQVERLSGMFYDLAKPFEVLDAEVERELLTLAMALARQIVRRELKTDPTQIIS